MFFEEPLLGGVLGVSSAEHPALKERRIAGRRARGRLGELALVAEEACDVRGVGDEGEQAHASAAAGAELDVDAGGEEEQRGTRREEEWRWRWFGPGGTRFLGRRGARGGSEGGKVNITSNLGVMRSFTTSAEKLLQ